MSGVFVIVRDARASVIHVRRRDDEECIGCIEAGLFDCVLTNRGVQSELLTSLKLFDEHLVLISKSELDLKKLDLSKVKVPVYNLATKEDHIAPAESVLYGSKFFGGPVK